MNKKQFEIKKAMVTDIIQVLSASGTYISGDMFFRLIGIDNSGLRNICRNLYINVGAN